LVRDAYLTPESKRALEAMTARGGYLTEVKQEVFIPRIGGNANPRAAERVPAGAEFAFEMVYRVMDTGDGGRTDQENFKHVETALELLQLDGLGGYISRGYGQVALTYQVEER
jgi:CRISPR-associated protein Csm3